MGVEKRVTSTLLETSSVEKIIEIDRHIGCATSGLQADAMSMIEHARVECQSHTFNYMEPLRVESCTQAICDLALRFGEGDDGEESVMSRPFGVALLIAGYDEDGPQLYVINSDLVSVEMLSSCFLADITLSHQGHFIDTMLKPSVLGVKAPRLSFNPNIISL